MTAPRERITFQCGEEDAERRPLWVCLLANISNLQNSSVTLETINQTITTNFLNTDSDVDLLAIDMAKST